MHDRTHLNQEFLDAALHLDLNKINQYLEMGADINSVDQTHNCALFIAARNNYIPIVKYLIEQGADKKLALSKLSSINNKEIRSLLLNLLPLFSVRLKKVLGEDYLKIVPPKFRCPISKDIMNDPITLPNGFTYDRDSLRAYFKAHNYSSTLKCPLSRQPIDQTDLTASTSIFIKGEIEEFVSEQEKKHQNIPMAQVTQTPSKENFLKAVNDGHFDVVKQMLEQGISADSVDVNGITPLMVSAKLNRLDIVQLLLQYKANVHAQDKRQHTALHWLSNSTEIAIVLLDHNANINSQNSYLDTPLHIAISLNHANIIKLFVQKNANINISNELLQTPLMMAAEKNSKEIVELLIENGANLYAQDVSHYTAFDLVRHYNHSYDSFLHLLEILNPNQHRLEDIHYQAEIPKTLRCPLSGKIMNDPITLSSGITYDRQYLRAHFLDPHCKDQVPGQSFCPMTKLLIQDSELAFKTSSVIKTMIEEFITAKELEAKQCMRDSNAFKFFKPYDAASEPANQMDQKP